MSQVKSYSALLIGTFIEALCFTLLQSPNQLASGGTTGAALVLSPVLHISSVMILWAITFLLLGISFFFLGLQAIFKSIIGSLLVPLFIYLTKGLPPLTHDPLLASIYTGLGLGIGLSLIFSSGGNTGGFTVISQILFNKMNIKHSVSIIFMDASVLISGAFIFSTQKALYALLASLITRITMEFIQSKAKGSNKVAYIISSIEFEELISQTILNDLDRGLTKLSAFGGYTHRERRIMMTVIQASKVNKLKAIVQEIDPQSFIIICDTADVFGEGYSLPVYPRGKQFIS
ncbi:YitT family protein [Pullulanibacillus sp. KACC 23026]|uniref:YitT family protein n=1 Tax=Pullulanibacillus sp. KACC 23026 TaxID=3028315 RepID=UPI0023B1537E|nr:YitT family protein [Pullulanibacillus sp. KACC 23026]WEG14590.1 YitT family protein [Pullulanibacillus sp. KACC 23026]